MMKEFFKGLIFLIITCIIIGILLGLPLYLNKCKEIREYHTYDETDEDLIYGEFPANEFMSFNIIKNDKPTFNYEFNDGLVDITASPSGLLAFYIITPFIIFFALLFIIYILSVLIDIIKKVANKGMSKHENTYELGEKPVLCSLVEFPNDLSIYSILLLRFGHNYSIEFKNEFKKYFDTLPNKQPIDELYQKYIALSEPLHRTKTFHGIKIYSYEDPFQQEIDDRYHPSLYDELFQNGYIIDPSTQKIISSILRFLFKYKQHLLIRTSKGRKLKKELKKYEKCYLSKKDPYTYSPEEELYMTILRNAPFF